MQRTGCHLVRGLRAWRYKSAFRTSAGGAVANGVNIRIARRLQCRLDHQLIDAVCFQSAQLFHKVRSFNACGPDHQIGFNVLAFFSVQSAFVGAGHHRLGKNTHAEFGQFVMRRTRNTRRQRRQNTLAGFHQRHIQRFIGQPFVAVAVKLFHRIMQLRRQLNPGRPTADNRDIHLAVSPQIRRELKEQVEHLLMETTRLMRVVEENTVLFNARRIEVVRGTAKRHDQRVVRQLALRHQ